MFLEGNGKEPAPGAARSAQGRAPLVDRAAALSLAESPVRSVVHHVEAAEVADGVDQ